MFFVCGVFCKVNTCRLPVGTESNVTSCNNDEAGCTNFAIRAGAPLFCSPGYVGSPMKGDVNCNTAGDNFTSLHSFTNPFCVGKRLIFNTCRRYYLYFSRSPASVVDFVACFFLCSCRPYPSFSRPSVGCIGCIFFVSFWVRCFSNCAKLLCMNR